MNVALRPATVADRAFVESVYFDTQRWIIEAFFGWSGDDSERRAFAQFYDLPNTQIIVVDGVDAGWLTVTRAGDIVIESIYLQPARQRQGIGSALIGDVIAEATAGGRVLRISTATINPARRLYERLGFVCTAEERYKVHLVYGG
jgi:GNAT superfamily N-acetyltransferase